MFRRGKKIVLFLILLFSFICGEAFPTMSLDEPINGALQNYLYALDDSDTLTFEEVCQVPFEKFVQIDEIIPRLKRNTFFWFAVSVKNNTSTDKIYYLESGLTQYIFFYDIENGKYVEKKYGYAVADAYQEYSEVFAQIIGVKLKAGEEKLLYFKIKSNLNLKPSPLFLIQTQVDYKSKISNFNLTYGIMIGLILMIVCYIIFLYIGSREVAYLYYIVYALLIALGTFVLLGYPRHWLFPHYRCHVLLSEIILQIDCLTYLFLFRRILEIDEKHLSWQPFFNIMTYIMIFGDIASLVFLFVDFYIYNSLTQIFTFISLASFVVIFVGLFRYRTKVTMWYFIGNIMMAVGALDITIGLLFKHEPFLKNLPQFLIGVNLELLCYSFGLSRHFLQAEKQRSEFQLELIEKMKENEKIQKEINENLEKEVGRRTIEILNSKLEIERQKADLTNKHLLLEESNKQLVDNLQYAGFIQRAMLHDFNLLGETTISDRFLIYKPHSYVSGDFYMFFNLSENKTLLIVADCTGHGVPGAILTIIAQDFIRNIVIQENISQPDKILSRLEDKIHSRLLDDSSNRTLHEGLDAAIVLIDKGENKLFYSGARLPIVFIHNGVMNRCKGSLFGIGGECYNNKEKVFELHTLEYSNGDAFYLSSDGYVDQLSDNKKKFLNSRYIELVKKIWQKPCTEQKEILISEHQKWRGSQEQTDDIIIIGIIL